LFSVLNPENPQKQAGLRVFRRIIGATGFEPADDFDASSATLCGCVICDDCRAANALHTAGIQGHAQSPIDADLRAVAMCWERLSAAQRKKIAKLARLEAAPSRAQKQKASRTADNSE